MPRALTLCALLAACSSRVPQNAIPPTADQWAVIDDIRDRWELRIGPLSARCQLMIGKYLVVDAERFDKLKHCWRDEPGQCAADASMSRWGCCAACAIVRDGHPIAVISNRLDDAGKEAALRHEAVHHLGHCSERWSHLTHRDPALWGPDGVYPL